MYDSKEPAVRALSAPDPLFSPPVLEREVLEVVGCRRNDLSGASGRRKVFTVYGWTWKKVVLYLGTIEVAVLRPCLKTSEEG
jgi:hypothetical protein